MALVIQGSDAKVSKMHPVKEVIIEKEEEGGGMADHMERTG